MGGVKCVEGYEDVPYQLTSYQRDLAIFEAKWRVL
jgi:hypothetical protein